MGNRLDRQLEFAMEIDKLKGILRQTLLTDGSRQENSAEHSWHLAMMAMLLHEYAPEPVDVLRVIKMLLVHDLVEIDAGDTFCYDAAGNHDKAMREREAASRLFGMLPPEQEMELRGIWEEFEANQTRDAKFATALDRLQPLLQNWKSDGEMWAKHRVKVEQVRDRMSPVKEAMPQVWPFVEETIAKAVQIGFLKG